MVAIATRNSVLAVVPQTQQNQLRPPQTARNYVPLQDDFAMEPNYGQIENLEIKPSIGRSASIQGSEDPTASLSFYLKGSGTEGVAPHWHDIAKSFFGTEVVEGTQRVIATAAANVEEFTLPSVAGSTAADFAVFFDVAGQAWAFSLDKTGASAEPTATEWTAIAGSRKAHVDISGGTDAASVAALVEAALNGLSGFGAAFTTDDSGGAGELLVTCDSNGAVPASVVSNAAGSGSGSIAVARNVRGYTATTASLFQVSDADQHMQKGYGMLIKDGVNGFRVRVAHSVDGDAVEPSFVVPVAPAAGVGLGKPVYWVPANEDHQLLSLWWYGGNGGVVQAVSDTLITSFGWEMAANDAINASASFESLAWYLNPIEITTDRYIDWTDDDGTHAAAISAKVYKDPHEIAEALTVAMNAVGSSETATVTYLDASGRFNIKTTGSVLSILWQSGTNAANSVGTKLRFNVAANDTGTAAATGYTSDNQLDLDAPHTPEIDPTQPNVAKNQEVMIGDQEDYACFNASSVDVAGTNGRRTIDSICAESGRSGALINSREFSIEVSALLEKYDAKQFARFRKGSFIRFQATIGPKDGGQWIPGNVVYGYSPYCKITAISIANDDGLASLSMTLEPAVPEDGSAEFIVGQC